MTHNRENAVILNNAKQYILNNTIANFGFSLKNLKFCLYLIEYKIDLICNLYKTFKKAKIYLDILNSKT